LNGDARLVRCNASHALGLILKLNVLYVNQDISSLAMDAMINVQTVIGVIKQITLANVSFTMIIILND